MPTKQQIIAAERRALMKLLSNVPLRSVDENVLLASWNIAQFSDRKKSRALQYIADICERFDIVAIQEVKTNLQGLAKLQKLLPGHYQILVSDPTALFHAVRHEQPQDQLRPDEDLRQNRLGSK